MMAAQQNDLGVHHAVSSADHRVRHIHVALCDIELDNGGVAAKLVAKLPRHGGAELGTGLIVVDQRLLATEDEGFVLQVAPPTRIAVEPAKIDQILTLPKIEDDLD